MKKTTEHAPKKQYTPRWSIGLFRNPQDGLSTVYVTKEEGVPMPYEQARVGKAKILFHSQYVGMKYSEARQQLLKDAAKKGIKPEESKQESKPAKTTSAKAEEPKKPKAAAKSQVKPKDAETKA
jgi:hypothetical protein